MLIYAALSVAGWVAGVLCSEWWRGEFSPRSIRTARDCLDQGRRRTATRGSSEPKGTVERLAHNQEAGGSSPPPATRNSCGVCLEKDVGSEHFCTGCGQCVAMWCPCPVDNSRDPGVKNDVRYLPENHPLNRDEPPSLPLEQPAPQPQPVPVRSIDAIEVEGYLREVMGFTREAVVVEGENG